MLEPEQSPGLRDILAGVARSCPGVRAAVLVDAQGMMIDRFIAEPDLDPEEVAVEFSTAIPPLGRAAVAARLGRPVEWLLSGENGLLVVRRLGNLEYFLLLSASSSTLVGMARFATRMIANRLEAALSV